MSFLIFIFRFKSVIHFILENYKNVFLKTANHIQLPFHYFSRQMFYRFRLFHHGTNFHIFPNKQSLENFHIFTSKQSLGNRSCMCDFLTKKI